MISNIRKKNKISEKSLTINRPDRISSYFKKEMYPLTMVTVSGILTNIGLVAGPFFEGQLAQKLFDIMGGKSAFSEMVILATIYVFAIIFVQVTRCLKRYYVRRFGNDTSLYMRHMLYNNLVHQSKKELDSQSVGELMTRAITDVDACAEGMRKFTTEIFDTGIALISYFVMMLCYDWKLAIIACFFPPFAYFFANGLRKQIYKCNLAYKKSASELNDATMERVSGAMTYRVFSGEDDRNKDYEKHLKNYEKSSIRANMFVSTQPIYKIIATAGIVFILFLGSKNVLGTGYKTWDIAAFTAFQSCFIKLALKSSRAANLFNAVQRAQVSWKRVKPLMKEYQSVDKKTNLNFQQPVELIVENLSFKYGDGNEIFSGITFSSNPGDIIGVTGPVACGKSTLGKVFLCEEPYEGNILIGGKELKALTPFERNNIISYLGHSPELMSDSVNNNISFGDYTNVDPYLKAVRMDSEIDNMPQGKKTEVGSRGVRLSGGQQDRLALARTLYHRKKIVILDDPFSAVDKTTEKEIMKSIKELNKESITIILSHRVSGFCDFSKIIWMENGKTEVGTHEELMRDEPHYAKIYSAQQQGGDRIDLDEQR